MKRQTETDRQRQTDRLTDRQRQTERQRENSNSKTLILKDSSVRSIWTYLTASPCYTTNTNKHKREREREREQSCILGGDFFFKHVYTMQTRLSV